MRGRDWKHCGQGCICSTYRRCIFAVPKSPKKATRPLVPVRNLSGCLPPSRPLPRSLLRSTATRGWPGWYQPDLERMPSQRVFRWGPEARHTPQVTQLVNRAPGSAHFLLLGQACPGTRGTSETPGLGPGPGRGQSFRRQGGRSQASLPVARGLSPGLPVPDHIQFCCCFLFNPLVFEMICVLTSFCVFDPPLEQTKNCLFFYLVFLIFLSYIACQILLSSFSWFHF